VIKNKKINTLSFTPTLESIKRVMPVRRKRRKIPIANALSKKDTITKNKMIAMMIKTIFLGI